jgi:hypothetical protein
MISHFIVFSSIYWFIKMYLILFLYLHFLFCLFHCSLSDLKNLSLLLVSVSDLSFSFLCEANEQQNVLGAIPSHRVRWVIELLSSVSHQTILHTVLVSGVAPATCLWPLKTLHLFPQPWARHIYNPLRVGVPAFSPLELGSLLIHGSLI